MRSSHREALSLILSVFTLIADLNCVDRKEREYLRIPRSHLAAEPWPAAETHSSNAIVSLG